MTTITRERVAEIIHAAGLEPCDYEEVFGSIKTGEIVAMARIALASLEAEPYGYVHKAAYEQVGSCGLSNDYEAYRDSSTHIPLYAAPPAPVVPDECKESPAYVKALMKEGAYIYGFNACRAAMLRGSQPASNRDELREQIRREHAEWSQATFGDVGPVGPLKHLSKEALEAAAEPDDLSEWADMQFLLWDAQRRAGISDGEITAAMEEKLKVNMARQWPEPKDGEPRQHIQNDWQSCNHLLPIGELLKRLNEQTGEEWVSTTDLDYGKWVKCSDRMPVKMVNVLVFDAGGNKFICCQENGFWRDFRVGSSRHEITHWMALPEIPLEIK